MWCIFIIDAKSTLTCWYLTPHYPIYCKVRFITMSDNIMTTILMLNDKEQSNLEWSIQVISGNALGNGHASWKFILFEKFGQTYSIHFRPKTNMLLNDNVTLNQSAKSKVRQNDNKRMLWYIVCILIHFLDHFAYLQILK